MITITLNNGKVINAYEANKDEDVEALIDFLAKDIDSWRFKWDYTDGGRYAHYFANYPVSFDIETSSFYSDSKDKFYTIDDVNKELKEIYDKAYEKQLKKLKDKRRARNKATIASVRACDKYFKRAAMYIWQMAFGTNDCVVIGRTWYDWVSLLATLKNAFDLNETKEFIIYVHNLHYEWGFIKRNFTWNKDKTFLSDKVTYYATTEGLYYEDPEMPRGIGLMEFSGFRFKDSLILSGCKEEKLPELMPKYGKNYEKLTGNLDYNLVRHSETPLTNEELAYCISDVLLLNWYIREKMEDEENLDKKGRTNILNIALTKTGEVRRECKKRLFYSNTKVKSSKDYRKKEYTDFLERMKFDLPVYLQIRRAFQGGFTHANRKHIGKVLTNIISADLKSSYPAVMLFSDNFPMGPYEEVVIENMEEFENYIENYSCLFDIHLKNVYPRHDDGGIDFDLVDNIISVCKAVEFGLKMPHCKPDFDTDDEKHYANNGRLRYAKDIYLSINHIDYKAIKKFYSFDELTPDNIDHMRVAPKGYLPKPLIEYVLELFRLKELSPTKFLRNFNKTRLNSLFGMIATDILKESFALDEDNNLIRVHSGMSDEDIMEMQEKQLEEKASFLAYQWSTILTSEARFALFRCIEASGYNHVYSDTDSEKFIENEKTYEFIENYNNEVDEKINKCFDFYHMPHDGHIINGKCLGHWEIENEVDDDGYILPYKRFVTAGAKRYLTETYKPDDHGETVHLTCAGLTKKAIGYLQEKYGDKLFEEFGKGNIYVEKEHTGKLAATYIDYSTKGEIIDYDGRVSTYGEMSSVHLEPVDFDMKICEDFDLIKAEGEMNPGL